MVLFVNSPGLIVHNIMINAIRLNRKIVNKDYLDKGLKTYPYFRNESEN